EVIKYGVIRERELLTELRHSVLNLPDLVRRSAAIKASFVEADEKETTGCRALLNFGHTLGHGIEAAAGYGRLLHGEAVALGMVAAAHVSVRRAGFPENEVTELVKAIEHFNLPTKLSQQLSREEILKRTLMDKKFADAKIRFVVASRLGNAFVSSEVTLEDLEFGLTAIEA
ncbi:MAG: 3-dehydroquinate synthase, partial [Verrucomicrobia bacterium]|nr:3-dehydroquinate synthase [Verrucomicrobiota bacterium]